MEYQKPDVKVYSDEVSTYVNKEPTTDNCHCTTGGSKVCYGS